MHAVVIGATVAGLLSARVLSQTCERVTIVERDELPALGEGRKAAPRGRHAHDPVVARAFTCAGDLLEPPGHVLRPGIAWRVLRGNLRPVPS